MKSYHFPLKPSHFLLKVYDFVAANKQDLEYKAVPLLRVDPEEMTKILSSIFQEFDEDVKTVYPYQKRYQNEKQVSEQH